MKFTAVIRTVVQALITWLLTLGPVQALVEGLTDQGVEINWEDVSTTTAIIVLAGVTAALNAAGDRWPVVNKIISLGRSGGSANYS